MPKMTAQATAPSSPATGDYWVETDVTPHAFTRWNGSSWAVIGDGNDGGGTATVPGWYNVKASPYSAVGNGSTDDTAAIQAAIDASHAASYEGIVYIPPGNYKVTATLTFYAGTRIVGGGSGSSHSGQPKILWYGADNLDVFSQSAISEPSNSHFTSFTNLNIAVPVTFTGSNGSAITGGTGTNTFRDAIRFTNRGDMGSGITDCSFGYGYGYGVNFIKGGINVQVQRCRSDGMRGGLVNFAPAGSSSPNDSLTVYGPWTLDNRIFNENSTGGGGITIDQTNNGICYLFASAGKLECNNLVPSGRGMFEFLVTSAEGTQPQINANLDTIWVAHASSPVDTTGQSSLLVSPATDYVDITLTNCQFRNIVGIPGFTTTESLTGIGGRHPRTHLGSRGPILGGSSTEHRIVNEYVSVNQHQPPYYHGKQASLVLTSEFTSLPAGTTVEVGDYAQIMSGNVMTEKKVTARGTIGTLSGVTGSITSGATALTVNTTAGLRHGQAISIAGAGAAGAALSTRIVQIFGTAVTLNNSAGTTVAGAAVSYVAPTIIAFPTRTGS